MARPSPSSCPSNPQSKMSRFRPQRNCRAGFVLMKSGTPRSCDQPPWHIKARPDLAFLTGPKHSCPGPGTGHAYRHSNRQLGRLVARVCKLLLSLGKQDVLKSFEVKALYKIVFKYLGLLSITIL